MQIQKKILTKPEVEKNENQLLIDTHSENKLTKSSANSNTEVCLNN